MAGQSAAPQLAISVLAAPPRRTEAKKNAGPPPKTSTFRNLRWPAAGLYIPLCLFLAVEGLWDAFGVEFKLMLESPGVAAAVVPLDETAVSWKRVVREGDADGWGRPKCLLANAASRSMSIVPS
jgi:hypothetical protein